MARRYKRDSRGRFASTSSGGGSGGAPKVRKGTFTPMTKAAGAARRAKKIAKSDKGRDALIIALHQTGVQMTLQGGLTGVLAGNAVRATATTWARHTRR